MCLVLVLMALESILYHSPVGLLERVETLEFEGKGLVILPSQRVCFASFKSKTKTAGLPM